MTGGVVAVVETEQQAGEDETSRAGSSAVCCLTLEAAMARLKLLTALLTRAVARSPPAQTPPTDQTAQPVGRTPARCPDRN